MIESGQYQILKVKRLKSVEEQELFPTAYVCLCVVVSRNEVGHFRREESNWVVLIITF
jgi:hypothetical protein